MRRQVDGYARAVPMDDPQTLIDRVSRGDDGALAPLLERHLPHLEAYVRLEAGRLVRAKHSIADLVQSVCADALRDAGGFEFRGETAFRHWLCKRALHKILDKKRHWTAGQRDAAREARGSLLDRPSVLACYATICTPSAVAEGDEAVDRFEAAFDELHADYREAITLYRIVGMSYPEIAAEMGRSEGAVRNLVYRGLARLAALLDEG